MRRLGYVYWKCKSFCCHADLPCERKPENMQEDKVDLIVTDEEKVAKAISFETSLREVFAKTKDE